MYRTWHLTISPRDAGFVVVSRARVYTILIRKDIPLLYDPAVAFQLLKRELPNRLPSFEIPDMVVATPEEVLEFENVLRQKKGLAGIECPSSSWIYLLNKSQLKLPVSQEYYLG